MSERWGVFLDRDGILNEPVAGADGRYESPYHPDDVIVPEAAIEALRALRALGVPLAVVSNQPSAAKGTCTLAQLEAVHRTVDAELRAAGVAPDAYRYCFHHESATDPALAGPCDCRKPEPGMIVDLARALGLDLHRSWVIGDSEVDVEAGRRAGCHTILVDHPRTAHRRPAGAAADHRVPDLASAVSIVARAAADAREPVA
jgi:D-glycero-D-manno-heptose 1,7-bisphosphate phosphatase